MCIHCAVTHNPSDYVHLMICWLSSLQVSERNVKNIHVQKGYNLIWKWYSARGTVCLFKHDLVLWLWGVTVKILHIYRVIFICSTQQALPNGGDSSHFTEGETEAQSSYLTHRPNS